MEYILFVGAAICSLAGYYTYFRKITKNSITPNRWSWLIWSFATLLETITYDAVSDDVVKTIIFYISSVACILITIKIWRKAQWKRPDDWSEICSVVASFAAILIWIIFHQAWWAHAILLVSLPIAFIPTYKDAWANYTSEDTIAWLLWSIGDLLAIGLVVSRLQTAHEIPYAIAEFICHIIVVIIVTQRKLKVKQVLQ